MNYYLLKKNEKVGPFDVATIKEKLTQGEVGFFDKCWSEGMADWQVIKDTLDLEGMTVPPPPPVEPQPAIPPPCVGEQPTFPPFDPVDAIPAEKPLNWIPAFVSLVACLGFEFLAQLSIFYADSEITAILSILAGVSLLVHLPLILILLYKCWQAVPSEHRVTTPGKAVGFLFIPIYNIFWAFTTWPKLVEGLRKGGYNLPRSTDGLALVAAIEFACMASLLALMLLVVPPDLPILDTAMISDPTYDVMMLIVFALLYKQLTKAINERKGLY